MDDWNKLGRRRAKAMLAVGLVLGSGAPAHAQGYSLPADLEAKIAKHPHVRKLTDWGSRPEWSRDGKRLLFVTKEYGDLFELEIATGKQRPMSFHFPHAGIFRGNYLPNGDILISAPAKHDPDHSMYGRFFESELWIMKGDLSAPPVRLGAGNLEGVAVSPDAMRIAWATVSGDVPERKPDDEIDLTVLGRPTYQLWTADIAYAGGKPQLDRKRLLLDCKTGPLAALKLPGSEHRCYLEPQNYVPGTGKLLFTVAVGVGPNSFVLDEAAGKVTQLVEGPYSEPEGVFPDGRYAAVEHVPMTKDSNISDVLRRIDLWRVALDGSGARKRMTFFNQLDRRLKSNQAVISPDGRWMAFGISTGDVEARVAGQGVGIYLMDLQAAGLR